MSYTKIVAASLLALGAASLVMPSVARAADTMQIVDADHDGTIDLAEAKKAGLAMFGGMDKDHEGTVDAKESMNTSPIMSADTDKDGTVDKTEYAAGLEAAFKKADTDNDGTVDAKELDASSGSDLKAFIVPKN